MANDLFLVTSGNIGDEVAALLARQGQSVRLLVHERKAMPALDALGVEQAAIDLNQPATLAPGFAGGSSYFSVTPFSENLVQLGENAVHAAKAAGVRHFVRSSARFAAPDAAFALGRWHGAVEQLVKKSGMSYTILQPASFIQNTLYNAATIARQHLFYGSTGTGPAALIDTRDIAAAAVTVLTGGAVHYGQTYDLTGPKALTNYEVADIFTDVLGHQVEYANLSEDEIRESMLQAHSPVWMVDTFLELDRITRQGYAATATPDFTRLTGQPGRTLRAFVQENRAAFQSATTT
ncbi:SDR family oxidoreductase [Hymenobacter terrenus]|uniref:SDR family oxidoreductase n=1 Tax=Hymenobacter terrenus TaxID=1629124 RepID=UPI0006199F4C|nr:SDR family oxidoreductase [Hymenobacter terrenus]